MLVRRNAPWTGHWRIQSRALVSGVDPSSPRASVFDELLRLASILEVTQTGRD